MAITKVTTPDLIDLPTTISSVETNTDGVVLAKGSTSGTASVDYLVVAGGGGGGGRSDTGSGGGGAGGLLTSIGGSALILNLSTNYTVNVGLGGTGGYSNSTLRIGNIGNNSIFDTISTIGGGGGGAWAAPTDATAGGSGGGGAYSGYGGAGAGTSGQGNDGGVGSSGINQGAGGGGGAGAVGANGRADGGGNGGVGLQNTITGASPTPYYAGGGGGGLYPSQNPKNNSTGGLGGGADGTYNSDGLDGDSNTGGGGGGTGQHPFANGYGGDGGSGVVILRTVSTTTATFSGGVTYTLDNTTVAGQNIYTITATTDSSQTVTFSSTVSSDARPVTGGSYILEDGEFRYNTTTKKVEYYDGANWFTLTSTMAVPQAGTTGVCNYPTTATALYQLNDNVTNSCNNVNAVASNITYSSAIKKFGTHSAIFSGSGSYITTPIDFSTFTDYSVSMWIYPTATGAGTATGTGFGGTVDAGTDYGFFLSINSSNQIRFYERTGSPVTQLTSSNAVTLNTWNNIVAIRNGSTNFIYVNNTVTSEPNSTITHTSDFIFGRAGLYASDSYTGNIDQARIFPSALTATQVTALYEETAP